MCDRPIMIDNPYRGLASVGHNMLHDCTSAKIPVPCGNCPTCIALRQNYFVQRAQMEQLDNFLFMGTLTYSNDTIRRIQVNGYSLKYADFTDVQKMFKRLRKGAQMRPFRYFIVSENGGVKHRPHFHFLLSVPRYPKEDMYDALQLEYKYKHLILKEWRRNVGSRRNPNYIPLCKYIVKNGRSTYDFHYINPSLTSAGEEDVAFYTTKYLMKSSDWLNRLKSALKLNLSAEDFNKYWFLLKPRCCVSRNWGDPKNPAVIAHIRKGIDASLKSDSEFPYYINPYTGNTFALSPFYQKRFLTLEDKYTFYFKSDNPNVDNYVETDERNYFQSKVKQDKFNKNLKRIDSRENRFNYLDDDFEDYEFPTTTLEKDTRSDCWSNFDFSSIENDF